MKSLMASFFLLVCLSLSCLWICGADLIADVCSKAVNPTLCKQVFSSDPRSTGANLQGLGQIIVEQAKAATRNTISEAKAVKSGAYAEKADTCVETCNDALDNLNECASSLKSSGRRSISDLQTKGSAALSDVSTCDDEFGNEEPASLKAASRRAQDIIDILLVIANHL